MDFSEFLVKIGQKDTFLERILLASIIFEVQGNSTTLSKSTERSIRRK